MGVRSLALVLYSPPHTSPSQSKNRQRYTTALQDSVDAVTGRRTTSVSAARELLSLLMLEADSDPEPVSTLAMTLLAACVCWVVPM